MFMHNVYAYLGGSERIEALFAESSISLSWVTCDTVVHVKGYSAPVEQRKGNFLFLFPS